MRIGAVNYLNSKPLVYGLEQLAPGDRLLFDLPSRLADSLAAGRLDVALIPSVEFFRTPGYTIRFRRVRGMSRPRAKRQTPFSRAAAKRDADCPGRRIANERGAGADSAARVGGSYAEARAAADRKWHQRHECRRRSVDRRSRDATGRRVVRRNLGPGRKVAEWTGLPFVFAMWVARAGVEVTALAATLAAARDQGVAHLAEIAASEAPPLGLSADSALSYLRDNLHFTLGDPELQGLRRFYDLCVERDFVPRHIDSMREQFYAHGCSNP